ncbi:MAG: phosphotransferase family protein [Janthinobacterium lividum]
MYLDAASAFSPPTEVAADAGADDILKQQLWAQVRTAFPDLAVSRLRLEQSGGDHLLLIADDRRAFRFPRSGKHCFQLEAAVLQFLGPRAQLAIPDYDVVDPAGRFASYLLISGVPLTPARFSALTADTAQNTIITAVTLLTSLHALDPQTFQPIQAWPRMWSPIQFADRFQTERLSLLVESVPTLAAPVEEFLQRYRHDQAPREVVLHGDLVSDHLLVDEQTGCLTGIIDFSDVALGDPAHDLLGFWAYGASAAAQAVSLYDEADADPTLLNRSRNHFIRYRIDRLFEMIADGAGDIAIRTRSSALAALLADPHAVE